MSICTYKIHNVHMFHKIIYVFSEQAMKCRIPNSAESKLQKSLMIPS